MTPGVFALFGPDDAHMPGISPAGRTQSVKKAVMKISTDISF
jgi:beta-galactosidase beta subunit